MQEFFYIDFLNSEWDSRKKIRLSPYLLTILSSISSSSGCCNSSTAPPIAGKILISSFKKSRTELSGFDFFYS